MRKFVISILTVFITFASCKDSKESKLLPNVTGKSGEVVLVIDPEHWNSDIGTAFTNTMNKAYPALPQPETMFDLVHIPYDAFTNIFKTHRNLIFTKKLELLNI